VREVCVVAYDDQTPSYGGTGNLLPDPTEWITHNLLGLVDQDESKRKQRMSGRGSPTTASSPTPCRRSGSPGRSGGRRTTTSRSTTPRSSSTAASSSSPARARDRVRHQRRRSDDSSRRAQADEAAPEDELLEAFWKQAGGSLTFQKLAQNGGVCGHSFAKLTEPAATQAWRAGP
jgi:hypothetical protein